MGGAGDGAATTAGAPVFASDAPRSDPVPTTFRLCVVTGAHVEREKKWEGEGVKTQLVKNSPKHFFVWFFYKTGYPPPPRPFLPPAPPPPSPHDIHIPCLPVPPQSLP